MVVFDVEIFIFGLLVVFLGILWISGFCVFCEIFYIMMFCGENFKFLFVLSVKKKRLFVLKVFCSLSGIILENKM